MPKVFFITGCSTGFGFHYAQAVLDGGDYVVASARNKDKLEFKNTNDKNYLPVSLDVTSRESVEASFKAALDKFGQIDVVCNNAGYGLAGPFETLGDDQIRKQMEVNFFGLLDVTRVALETMREKNKQQGGTIQFVTSIGGQLGKPNFSIYCASKFAVEGYSEALRQELKDEWKIKLSCIEPGGFRTDWAGRSMQFGSKKIAAYDHMDAEETMGKVNGTQVGEPKRGGEAMYELGKMSNPPPRIVLGSDAYKQVTEKYGPEGHIKGYKENEKISLGTDVDDDKKA